MSLQPTASKTDQLLTCTWPFGREVPRDIRDQRASDYGSAFHELMALALEERLAERQGALSWVTAIDEVAKRWGAPAEELDAHIREALPVLLRYLEGDNPFHAAWLGPKSRAVVRLEVSYATRATGDARRITRPRVEDHVYEDLMHGEIAGTADLVIVPRHKSPLPLLVLDHKTGQDEFYDPAGLGQLRTLAVAARYAERATSRRVVLSVFHARRRGMAKIYADEVPSKTLRTHELLVKSALARVGDGSMRPGPWCSRCPARDVCPASGKTLLEEASGALEALAAATGTTAVTSVAREGALSREKKLGLLYAAVQSAEKVAAAARDAIRQEVIAGALPEHPAGGYIVVQNVKRESLSKTSVLEAYGKLEGAKVLDMLRARGAIKTLEVPQMRVEKERGS